MIKYEEFSDIAEETANQLCIYDEERAQWISDLITRMRRAAQVEAELYGSTGHE